MRRDLEKRVARLESSSRAGEPSVVLSDSPMGDGEAQSAISNWRSLVAKGLATVCHGALCLVADKPMSPDEWEARYVR